MKKYKAVILGCGSRAKDHASAYRYIADVDLVACCDLDEERLNRFSKEFQLNGYTSLEEMVRQEKPDIVHLVTIPSLRMKLMREVSDLGVRGCVVEKPIALGVKDYLEISEFSSKTKTKFIVNHQYRYHPQLLKCREALESGNMGQILYMDCSARMNINNQGTHILDYIMSLNRDSRAVQVFGNASGLDQEDLNHPAPETTIGNIVFENGVRAVWSTGSSAPQVIHDQAIYKHCREAVYAEKGHVLFQEFNNWTIETPDGSQSGVISGEDWSDLNDRSQAALVHSLAKWLDNDKAVSESNLELALHQWNVVLGLYASALWRKPVPIPFVPPADLFEQLKQALIEQY